MDAAVIGAGSWGTALAILLARNGLDVALGARDPEITHALISQRENLHYLPGFRLPEAVMPVAISDLPAGGLTVIAVPSSAVQRVLAGLAEPPATIVLASKGLDHDTARLLSEVVRER
ncbi:MAG: glycerol-3-phosphate dehydrogenase, partial [Armatimonadota bacterium]